MRSSDLATGLLRRCLVCASRNPARASVPRAARGPAGRRNPPLARQYPIARGCQPQPRNGPWTAQAISLPVAWTFAGGKEKRCENLADLGRLALLAAAPLGRSLGPAALARSGAWPASSAWTSGVEAQLHICESIPRSDLQSSLSSGKIRYPDTTPLVERCRCRHLLLGCGSGSHRSSPGELELCSLQPGASSGRIYRAHRCCRPGIARRGSNTQELLLESRCPMV